MKLKMNSFCRRQNNTTRKYAKNASIVDENEVPKDVVSVGSIVKVKDYEFDEEVEYIIVGSAEADPMNNKISNESPVGHGLIGKKAGDIIEVAVPDGVSKYEILEVNRAQYWRAFIVSKEDNVMNSLKNKQMN